MSRPGIVRIGRPLDDEDRIRIGHQTERNGGQEPLGLGRRRGRMLPEMRREAPDGAQCE